MNHAWHAAHTSCPGCSQHIRYTWYQVYNLLKFTFVLEYTWFSSLRSEKPISLVSVNDRSCLCWRSARM